VLNHIGKAFKASPPRIIRKKPANSQHRSATAETLTLLSAPTLSKITTKQEERAHVRYGNNL
jgi:hypothetical protein